MVSVCTVTYQQDRFLGDMIEGVLNQNVDFPIEFIIADDASTDNTEMVVRHFINSHPNGNWIKYTKHADNKGVIGNFNWALKQCKGEYVAICEGDDYWVDLYKLKKQYDFMRLNELYSVCYHRCSVVNQLGKIIKVEKKQNYQDFTQEDLILGRGHLITNTVFFKNVVSYPAEALKLMNGDSILWHLLGFHGSAKFLKSIEPSAYRVHEGGVWSMKTQVYKLKNSLETYSFLVENLKQHLPIIEPKSLYVKASEALNDFMLASLAKFEIKAYINGIKLYFSYQVIRKRYFLKTHLKSVLSLVRKRFKKKKEY